MKKKGALILLLILSLLLPSITAMASEKPVVYKDTITVTQDGGRYQIGFINIEFKKDFLNDGKLSATFDVEVYAENGVGYIEFSPSTPNFYKKVHIRVDDYNGLLYDKATGQNIQVNFKKQQVLADHFSRYSW